MGIYDRTIQTVLKVISKKGMTVTFKRTAQTVPDINTPWDTIDSEPISKDIKMVFLPPSSNDAVLRYLAGANVAVGSELGYCGDFGYTPKLNDIIIRDGQTLTIKENNVFRPNGQVILNIIEFSL